MPSETVRIDHLKAIFHTIIFTPALSAKITPFFVGKHYSFIRSIALKSDNIKKVIHGEASFLFAKSHPL
jgi:hypothetical protein